jgi:sugar O-acyltransferase (sialic acid O-acetyltransferase NeuD family)
MSADLVIIGAGGFARETVSALEAANAVRPTWRLLGFLDDDTSLTGRTRAGHPILGPLDLVPSFTDAQFVVCMANPAHPDIRRRIVARLSGFNCRYATVVHPAAQIGAGSTVGAGSVLLAGTVLTADVTLGAHVAVMPHAVLTHDDVIEDYVTIAAGVRLGGSARIATTAYVGSGALIRESVTIGAGALIGMGAVVLGDVPADQVWVGNPARHLRTVQPALMGGPRT